MATEENDLLEPFGWTSNPALDGPTRVKVTGQERVVHDDPDGEGTRTEITQTDIYGLYSIQVAKYRQQFGDCSLPLRRI